jgi:uncharacterized protein (TIGR02646 family)
MQKIIKREIPLELNHRVRMKELKKELAEATNENIKTEIARNRFKQENFPTLAKQVLGAEQHGLCVYCERKIDPLKNLVDPTSIRVDHWKPLSKFPELALTWVNLHASCSFKNSCDSKKANTELNIPYPSEKNYALCLQFSLFGKVTVNEKAPLTKEEISALKIAINETLNLNHPMLLAARKSQIEATRTSLAKKIDIEKIEALKKKLLNNLPRQQFISASLYYLDFLKAKCK